MIEFYHFTSGVPIFENLSKLNGGYFDGFDSGFNGKINGETTVLQTHSNAGFYSGKKRRNLSSELLSSWDHFFTV